MNPGWKKFWLPEKTINRFSQMGLPGPNELPFCGIFQFFFWKLLHDIINPTFSSLVCIRLFAAAAGLLLLVGGGGGRTSCRMLKTFSLCSQELTEATNFRTQS